MEAHHHGEIRESYKYKPRGLEERHGYMLQAKMDELTLMKEGLKKAKDSAMQSWLDSRPLIDELEKLQSGLASAKNQASMSNVVISELESQLETTNASIKSKMEEELKVSKMTNEITKALEQLREELERLKQDTEEGGRVRPKLKQVLRLRRQTLQTLQLTLQAIQMETEAFGDSAATALAHIKSSESDNNTVELSQEEYLALKRRAKEETSRAKWRISDSMEKKLEAEASRKLASTRLKEIRAEKNMSRTRKIEKEKVAEDGYNIEKEDHQRDPRVKKAAQVKRATPFQKPRARTIARSNSANPHQQKRRSGSTKRNKKVIRKNKPSILQRIRSFFACFRRKNATTRV